MNPKERFKAIMNYEPADRLPIWYFGMWHETRERWQAEGLKDPKDLEQCGMDRDWEDGMWQWYGLADARAVTDRESEVLEETDDFKIIRNGIGAVVKTGKHGSSIPHTLEYALKPTRAAWEEFKRFLDPDDPRRAVDDFKTGVAALNQDTSRAHAFLGGSLYGWPRDWLGVEQLSFLPYDDPVLFEEILDYITDFYISVLSPLAGAGNFDFVYLFEDCCFRSGPLLSPDMYKKFFDRYYRKLIECYKSRGIEFVLLDSDGKVDVMIPLWLESGVDIMFPIEVGTWQADPVELRRQFGRDLRMMGGVNKHVIRQGEQAVRDELERLVPLAEEGGFIPLPDHRIPPDCSLEQFKNYIRIFDEVFNAGVRPGTSPGLAKRLTGKVGSPV